jgi:hypothetical protein
MSVPKKKNQNPESIKLLEKQKNSGKTFLTLSFFYTGYQSHVQQKQKQATDTTSN